MPEPSDSSEQESRQPFTHEDMLERIQTPRTTGTGRSGRKRKRRSHQPKKRKDRQRRVLVWAAVLIALPLLAAAVLGVMWNDWRVESESFRKEFSDHLSAELGAKVHVGPLKLQGRNISAPNLAITGKGEGGFRYAELRRLSAKLGFRSFFSSSWVLESLAVDECDLHFTAIGGETETLAGLRKSGADLPVASSVGLGSSPASLSVRALQVRHLNVFWGADNDAGPPQGLRGGRVFSGSLAEDGELLLLDGDFGYGALTGFELESADLRLVERRLVVEKALIEKEFDDAENSKSTIEVAGSFDFSDNLEADLKVTVANLKMEELVTKAWRSRIGGIFSGNLRFQRKLGDAVPGSLEGPFSVRDAWLRDLPLLDTLARISSESRFRRVEFDDGFSGMLSKRGSAFSITELIAEQPGLIKLRGEVAADADGALSGDLEVGVSEALLLAFPGGTPGFFGNAEAGFSFASLTPEGILDVPKEDLSRRMLEILTPGAPAVEPVKPGNVGVVSEQPVTRPPANAAPPSQGEKARIEQLFNALLE